MNIIRTSATLIVKNDTKTHTHARDRVADYENCMKITKTKRYALKKEVDLF